MKKLLLIIFLNSYLFSNYIEDAIVVCSSIKDIKIVEPHINKNSNKHIIPRDCLILTKNAQIELLKVIDNNYILILIKDLNVEIYTLKSLIKSY